MVTAIIILNYNNYKDTINCIESVERYNTSSIKYIVVDNGSTTPNCVDSLQHYFANRFADNYIVIKGKGVAPATLPYVTLMISKKNEGYARGNNIGLRMAYDDPTIDNVMVLNNDILFVEDIIPELKRTLSTVPDAAIVSPVLYKKNEIEIDYTCARRKSTLQEEIIYNILHWITPKYVDKKLSRRYMLLNSSEGNLLPIDLPSGSCMLLTKELFQKIDSFDPNTFLYWEEQILYEKIERINKKNYIRKDLKCIHLGGASTSMSVKSFFTLKCGNDSSFYYWKNYAQVSYLELVLLRLSMYFNNILTVARMVLMKFIRRNF